MTGRGDRQALSGLSAGGQAANGSPGDAPLA